jgi:hypothetical protein
MALRGPKDLEASVILPSEMLDFFPRATNGGFSASEIYL